MMSHKRSAFAMIEVVMATAIIGGLAVGAMSLVATAAGHKANAANLARGQMLCRSMAEEISTRPVTDWSKGSLNIEIDLGILKVTGGSGLSVTVGTGNRSTFKTIDSYHNYTESPPKDEDGNTLAGYSGWTRTVKVLPVEFANPNTSSASETGLRKVEITASHQGKKVATTTILRSSEWERVQP